MTASYPDELPRGLRGAFVGGARAFGAAGAREAPPAGGGHDAVPLPHAVVSSVRCRHRHAGGPRRAGGRRSSRTQTDHWSVRNPIEHLELSDCGETYGAARKFGILQTSTSGSALVKLGSVLIWDLLMRFVLGFFLPPPPQMQGFSVTILPLMSVVVITTRRYQPYSSYPVRMRVRMRRVEFLHLHKTLERLTHFCIALPF